MFLCSKVWLNQETINENINSSRPTTRLTVHQKLCCDKIDDRTNNNIVSTPPSYCCRQLGLQQRNILCFSNLFSQIARGSVSGACLRIELLRAVIFIQCQNVQKVSNKICIIFKSISELFLQFQSTVLWENSSFFVH